MRERENDGDSSQRRNSSALTEWCHYWYHSQMATLKKILDQMRREPTNVRFADLFKACEGFFGKPR